MKKSLISFFTRSLAVCMIVILALMLSIGCSRTDVTTPGSAATTASAAITATGTAAGSTTGASTTGMATITATGTATSTTDSKPSGTSETTIIKYTAQTTPIIRDSIERLVSSSDDVVVATVEQVLPTVRVDMVGLGIIYGTKPLYQNISSSRFRVDDVAMGRLLPCEQITLDLHGGVAEGVSEDLGIVYPKLGSTYLLFLRRPANTQDKPYFRFVPVDTFTSSSEIRNGQLFPDERAKAFKPGTQLDFVLSEVRRIVAALPIARATFSKEEVEQAKTIARDYFAAIAARDREALKRILYGGGDPDEIIGKTPKTTVLTLSFDPQDPARTSALIPDSRRNDFNNVIVLRAELRRTPAAVNGVTAKPETVMNIPIILLRASSSSSWRIVEVT